MCVCVCVRIWYNTVAGYSRQAWQVGQKMVVVGFLEEGVDGRRCGQ